jgi:hypothetical protein
MPDEPVKRRRARENAEDDHGSAARVRCDATMTAEIAE